MRVSFVACAGLLVVVLAALLHNVTVIAPILLFFLMNGAVVITALRITIRYYPAIGRRMFLEAVFLLSLSEIILVETFLGAAGLLNIHFILISIGAILLGVLWVTRKSPRRHTKDEQRVARPARPGILTLALWGFACTILTAMVAQAIVTPPYAWDSYTYHLHFPITWMKNEAISIVPTPFGHSLVAYLTCNSELFFLWLMLPFHDDFLTGLGQLPFLFVGALSLYGIARMMGIDREAASWPCLVFILAPAVVAQVVHPYVDIIFAALFLLSVDFFLRYWQDGKTGTLILFSISIGILFGVKGLAVPYCPLLFLPLALILLRRRRGISRNISIVVLGVITLGSFWYLRNLVVTGNPLYPLNVEILGITLFQGIYSSETLMSAFPHLSNLGEVMARVRMMFGGPLAWLILCSIPLSIVAFVLDNTKSLKKAYILVLPFFTAISFHYLTPGHHIERLLIIIIPLSALYPAYATTINRPLKWIIGGVLAACLAVTVWHNTYLTNMVVFVGITTLGIGQGGIPPARPAIAWTLLTALLVVACLALRNRHTLRRLLGFFVLFAAASSLAEATRYFATDSHKYRYRISWPHTSIAGFAMTNSYAYRPNPGILEDAWLFLDMHASEGANISWAGLNIPAALYGTQLKNNVCYVSITSHADWMEHDYDRFYREREGHHLLPTTKPGLYRKEAHFPSWLHNLRQKKINYLFITNLSPQELQYLRHDEQGFPLENIWARQHPETFTLMYTSPPSLNPWDQSRVRIYRVTPPTP